MRHTTDALLRTSGCALALMLANAASAQVTTTGANPAAASAPGSSPSTDRSSDDASSTGLGEIVVTATKTESQLSKVPISVAAFSQAQLDKQSVRSFADIARLTPGITLTPGTNGNGTGSNVSIRGISSGAGTATVGLYIDETPVQVRASGYYDSTNPYPRIFDLERVEVLRGPQGTLFGGGSEGGTIRFITPEPSLARTSVYARSELASTKDGSASYEAGAALGTPLVEDKIGLRVSAYYRHDGGYVDKVDWYDQRDIAQNVNWTNTVVLRGALKFVPVERVTITPAIFYQRQFTNDSSTFWENYSDKGSTHFVNANQIRTPSLDNYYLPSLKLNVELGGGLSLVSNSSYFHRDLNNTYDSTTLDITSFTTIFGHPVDTDPPPAALRNYYSPGFVTSQQRILTQEVRLQNDPASRLNFVLGGYFQRARQFNTYLVQNTFIDQELSYAAGVPLTVQGIFGYPLYQGKYLLVSQSHVVDKEIAGFGQVNFKITPKLTATAGARISHVTYSSSTFGAGPVLSSNGIYTNSHQSANPVTPKFGLSYQATPATLFYASAAKGFRPGSTAGQVANVCSADLAAIGLTTDPREIKPDTVWSYEAGVKSRFAQNRVYVDGSVFRIDWRNIQSTIQLPNCNRAIAANLGEARSQGFDLSINAKVTDQLTLGTSVGYADAKYTTQTLGAAGKVIRSKGEPLPIAPWQLTLSGEYDFTAFGRNNYLRADYQYLSHNGHALDLAVAGTDPTIPRAPASSNLDLRAGTRFAGFDVSAFVTNVTNQHPEYARYRDSLATFNYRGITVRPRTVGITAAYRY